MNQQKLSKLKHKQRHIELHKCLNELVADYNKTKRPERDLRSLNNLYITKMKGLNSYNVLTYTAKIKKNILKSQPNGKVNILPRY